MTIVALPLFKLELSYLVRHGRRWTALEQLLLWEVSQNAWTLADLCRGTTMPERLVVEALINLLKVGWIGLTTLDRGGPHDSVLFTANRRGRSAAALDEPPYAFDLEKRGISLFVDRLTTQALRDDEIDIRHRDQIDSAKVFILHPEFTKYQPSPVQYFDSLYFRPNDQFERQLGSRVTSLAQYAMLKVSGESIEGLPEDASPRLAEAILRRLPERHWDEELSTTASRRTARPLTALRRFAVVDIVQDDILVGGRDHRNELKRILQSARTQVYIHSTFMGGRMEALIPDFLAAAQRNVDVVLLWGEREDPLGEEPSNSWVKGSLAYRQIPPELRERVRLSPEPTGSHSKLLLADSGPDGSYEAVVGSCNWLSADSLGVEISLRLRGASIVREVAAIMASLVRPSAGPAGRDVTNLLRIQDRCRLAALTPNKEIGGGESPKGMLLLDDEHHAVVRDVRNAGASSVDIGCDLFGPAGETTVFEPLGMAAREDGTVVRVLYQRPTRSYVESVAAAEARYSHGTVVVGVCPRLHGKFLIWDDETFVITSFNWLAASSASIYGVANEVGVLVRDCALSANLIERIETATQISIKRPKPPAAALEMT